MTISTTKVALALGMFVVAFATTGCNDPTQNKPKAAVSDAEPTASGSTKPTSGSEQASYSVAADKSKFEFVGAKVTGTHAGGFKTFSGAATLNDGKPEGGSVKIEIDMKSVFSDDDKLTGHLQAADFFNVEKHPKATFTTTKVEKGGADGAHSVVGNLQLREVTKSIKFPATIGVSGDKVTVKAEFSINRKDFGIEYAGMADDLIRDDVLIKLDLTFEKQ